MPSTFIKVLEAPAPPRSLALRITQNILVFLLTRVILWWVPKASPDYDRKSDDVAYWLVEVEDGRAEREIGFDAQGEPILHAPTDRNMGLWTDSDREFVVDDYQKVDAQKFDLLWRKLEKLTGSQSS